MTGSFRKDRVICRNHRYCSLLGTKRDSEIFYNNLKAIVCITRLVFTAYFLCYVVLIRNEDDVQLVRPMNDQGQRNIRDNLDKCENELKQRMIELIREIF